MYVQTLLTQTLVMIHAKKETRHVITTRQKLGTKPASLMNLALRMVSLASASFHILSKPFLANNSSFCHGISRRDKKPGV